MCITCARFFHSIFFSSLLSALSIHRCKEWCTSFWIKSFNLIRDTVCHRIAMMFIHAVICQICNVSNVERWKKMGKKSLNCQAKKWYIVEWPPKQSKQTQTQTSRWNLTVANCNRSYISIAHIHCVPALSDFWIVSNCLISVHWFWIGSFCFQQQWNPKRNKSKQSLNPLC